MNRFHDDLSLELYKRIILKRALKNCINCIKINYKRAEFSTCKINKASSTNKREFHEIGP